MGVVVCVALVVSGVAVAVCGAYLLATIVNDALDGW